MATLVENAAAVKAASTAIDAAIVAKGGTTAGGLAHAAAAIAALPSGGEDYMTKRLNNEDWIDPVITVERIPPYAFYYYTNMKGFISLPNCKEIGHDGFNSNPGNASGLYAPNLERIGDHAFTRRINNPVIDANTVITLPKLTYHQGNPFDYCTVKELNFPALITTNGSIGMYTTADVITANALVDVATDTNVCWNCYANRIEFRSYKGTLRNSKNKDHFSGVHYAREIWLDSYEGNNNLFFYNVGSYSGQGAYPCHVYLKSMTSDRLMVECPLMLTTNGTPTRWTHYVWFLNDKYVAWDGTAWVAYEYDEVTPNPFTEG